MSSKRSTSKFDSNLAETLYLISLDGGADEECGSSSEGDGWFGRLDGDLLEKVVESEFEDEDGDVYPCIEDLDAREIRELAPAVGAILSESSSGQVGVTLYESEEDLQEAWRKIAGLTTDPEDLEDVADAQVVDAEVVESKGE